MPKVQLGDFEMYYEIHGKGTPLFFVSGLAGASTCWNPQIESFSKYFQVILHDHRGTGRSSWSRIKYSVEQMAADVLKLMDSLGIEKAHVVGHSTGGAIAQVIAIENPERLRKIVIYASWTKVDTYMRRCMEMRRVLLLKGGGPAFVKGSQVLLYPCWWINSNQDLLEQYDERLISSLPPSEIFARRIDAILAFDRSDELAKITTPTLVLCAKDDMTTPPYFSEAIARSIKKSKLRLLERGGHFLSQTMARDFNRIVLSFLRGQGSRKGKSD